MADKIRKDEGTEQEQVEKIDLGASLRKEHKDKKPVSRIAILIVLAVLIALGAVLAVVLPRVVKKDDGEQTESLKVALSPSASGEVVSIHVQGESDFTITKDESAVYHVSGMEDDQVNQNTCGSAFNNAASMEADQLVEADVQDLSAYGLDNPSARVTIVYSDAKLELELGDTSSVTKQVYCRVAGGSDVYALRAFFGNLYGGSILRYRGLSIPEISSDISDCRSIIIRRRGEEQVRFKPVENNATFASSTWQMTEPKQLWLDTGNLSELVESISNCKLYGYVGKFDDLSAYGLDDPWFEVIMSDTNGVRRTLSLGDEVEGENLYYCKIDDSGEVFTISTNYLDFATDFKVSTYLDAFTNIVSISYVDEVDVSDGTTSYALRIERQEQYDDDGNLKTLANGQPNYLETFFVDGKECQEAAFKSAYQTIIGVTISNLAEESKIDDTQKPVLTVKYILNNGADPVVIEYLPYDINNYCVRRDGAIDLICKKELVDAIMPAMADLKAGKLDKAE